MQVNGAVCLCGAEIYYGEEDVFFCRDLEDKMQKCGWELNNARFWQGKLVSAVEILCLKCSKHRALKVDVKEKYAGYTEAAKKKKNRRKLARLRRR